MIHWQFGSSLLLGHPVYAWHEVALRKTSFVAIDNAECDNDGHSAEAKQSQDEPAVFEAASHDIAEKKWRITGTALCAVCWPVDWSPLCRSRFSHKQPRYINRSPTDLFIYLSWSSRPIYSSQQPKSNKNRDVYSPRRKIREHEIQCKRHARREIYIYIQMRVQPSWNLSYRLLIYTDIDSCQTPVKCLYHSHDTKLYISY